MDYTLEELAKQLGLPDENVEDFVEQHGPLDESIALADASFWNAGQAGMLRDAIRADDPWSIAAGQLDALFRE